MDSILTKQQVLALKLLAKTNLAKKFYFSGGTVLSHFYLQHRKSEDLDFFCQEEFDPQSIIVALKSLKKDLGFNSVDFQNSFNRNLFFLRFNNDYILKLEFTYYPFQQIEVPKVKDGLMVDSAIDIAVNKLFTIAQKPRGRDYFDLYCLIQKYGYKTENLRMMAKQKFDWHVDPLQLASRFNEVDNHLDDPIIVQEIKKVRLAEFFHQEAINFKNEIIRK
ncbi:nucleotidyl transferase AbiEii/AbiGii toxin family protein [Patescibacteria group bacterium]|nr:nucleotidyl transferase AbiEii/AbiGii toxin family protein [Patescibacteria group bacterium]MBU1885389.1 nucleotidyl transferase AbiEii/AbiGii toxin family protein [Patescibacteria group bacterium]